MDAFIWTAFSVFAVVLIMIGVFAIREAKQRHERLSKALDARTGARKEK